VLPLGEIKTYIIIIIRPIIFLFLLLLLKYYYYYIIIIIIMHDCRLHNVAKSAAILHEATEWLIDELVVMKSIVIDVT